jgi:NADH dehydrogenase/NADH:ubiquinone oxidoreductase subunit G
MRVPPRPDEDVNQQRIPDKTRFSYDGSKNQRSNYPMIRVSAKQSGPVKPKGHDEFINQSRKQILPLVSERLHTIAKGNVNGIRGVTGQFIDEETIPAFKRLLNHLGIESSNISIQNPESK